jgi:polysaccharide export outer membrane protein
MTAHQRCIAGTYLMALLVSWQIVGRAQESSRARNPGSAGTPVQDSQPGGGRTPLHKTAAESAEYRIGPEDVLDILVWKNADLIRTVQVRPDGKISLPLVNDVQAGDLTAMELREVLAKGYAKYFTEPEISVSVREVHSLKVSVLGMVKAPGRYDLKSQATVLEALALAGGLGDFAKRDRIFVSRWDGAQWKRIGFNYSKVLDGDDQENFFLQRGDIIIVP